MILNTILHLKFNQLPRVKNLLKLILYPNHQKKHIDIFITIPLQRTRHNEEVLSSI